MSTLDLMKQARTLVRESMHVATDDAVAIVWDGTTGEDLVQAARIAVDEIASEAAFVTYSPIAFRPRNELCHFAGRSLKEPLRIPRPLMGALAASDVALLFVSDLEMLFSPDVQELKKLGVRGLMTPYLDTAGARRLLPTTATEAGELKDITDRLVDVFTAAHTAQVTSPGGTNVTLRIGKFPTRGHNGAPERGQFQVFPQGLVAVAPDNGSANGVIVIDRTIAHHDYRELQEPIRLHVKDGTVTSIEGGVQAKSLQRFIEDLDDERAFHLTELGIGTNPRCKFAGVNGPTEDTHASGGLSFALGCDSHLGGDTTGPVHIDMTMRLATLTLDDRVVLDEGRLLAPPTTAHVR